jgi:predicted CoA-binding protein
MKNFEAIPEEIREITLKSKSLAIWSIDENPLSDSYQIARFFQDEGWAIYPVHDSCDRILEVLCYRDIRLIPDDYDVLYLFCDPESLPHILNHIFLADYQPKLIWTHTGIIDIDSRDRCFEGNIPVVMDTNLREFYEYWQYK